MPHAIADIVGARAVSRLRDAVAGETDPGVHLEGPDAAGHEARRDEVEEAGGDDEEDLEGRFVAASVLAKG